MDPIEVKKVLLLTLSLAFGFSLMWTPTIFGVGGWIQYFLAVTGFLVALASFGIVIYTSLTH